MGKRTAVCALALATSLAFAPTVGRAQDFTEDERDAYVQGNLLFLAYHEVGHLILDALLDVDQRQDRLASEEVADDIATWLMLPDPDEPDQDEEIWAAMEGWVRSANTQDEPLQNPHYPDDVERASRIACYLYGSNPDLYAELADIFSNTVRSVDCVEELEVLEDDFEDWFGDQLIPPAAPGGGSISVQYAPANGQDEARTYLIESGILEDVAEDISSFVRLPVDVSLVAQSCGAGAAEFRYSAARRQVTACYEAVDWFLRDASDELQERAAIASGARPRDDMGSGGARVTQRPR